MSEILHKDLIGEDIHELKVTVSAAPPSSVPVFVGQGYYDLVAKKFYVAQGTSLLSDWITTDIPPFLTFLDTRTISWTSTTSGGGTQITYSANVEEAELILTSTNITDFSNAVLTLPEIVSLLADQHTRLILRTGGEPNPTVWNPAAFNGLELDSDSQKIKLSQNLSVIGDPTFNETTLTVRSRTPLLTLTSGGTPTAASLYLDASKGMVARGFAGSTSSLTLQNEAGDDVLKNPVSTNQLVAPSLGGLSAPYVVHSDANGLLSASKLVDADVDAAAAIAGTKVSPDFGSQDITTTGSVLVDTIESNTNDIGILTGNDNKTILIGTGSGYNTINLGGANTTVNISGAVYTTPVEYVTEDKNIVVNFNASGQDSPDSGVYVQEEYNGALINLTDATWQAGNTVRYAVDMAGIDGLVAGEYVRITGFVNTQNNGTFKVLVANAGYIDVVNPKRTDASKDETGVAANAARLLLNGYIHVGSTRMSWEVRAPAHAGIIELKPQSTAKTLQITSESSNDVTVKFNTNLTVDQDLQKTSSVEFANAKISTFSTGIVHSNASGQLSSSLIQNADVDGSAAIAGTKISPDFGSQNITTTGDLSVSSVKVTGTEPVGGANFFTSATNGLVLRGVAGTAAQFKLISDLGVNFVTITDTSVTFHSLTNGVVKASSGTLSSSLLVNADVDAAAAIAGTKISPDFGSQNIQTTGSITGNSATISGFSSAGIVHNDALGNLTSSAIVNADVSATAAIAGTKISPNFGSQNIITTGSMTGNSATVTGFSVAGVVHNDALGNLTSSAIVNADVSGSAAIAGTKISPDFGSQNIQTTGSITGNSATISGFSSAGIVHNDALGGLSTSLIVDVDVSPSAAIADSKLATISSAGKVLNSATTATNANTANAIVSRDANGDFVARKIQVTDILGTSNALNLGTSSDTVTVLGNFAVQGTTTTLNTSTLDVEDKNITVNKGGLAAAANDSGLTIEGDGAAIAGVLYDSALESKFKLGASGLESEVITSAGAQQITDKTATNFSISNYEDLQGVITTTTPSSNYVRFYAKTDGKLYLKASDGLEFLIRTGADPYTPVTNPIEDYHFESTALSGPNTFSNDEGILTFDFWSGTGPLNVAKNTLAGSGTQNAALAFGGTTGTVSATAEKFNGTAWSATGSLGTARSSLAGSGTQNAALAFGGVGAGFSAITEKFNGNTWSATGSLGTARGGLAGSGTQNAALAFGGETSVGIYSAITEKFNGTAWSATGSLSVARTALRGSGTQDAALAFGGTTGTVSAITEKFNGNTWSTTGSLGTARSALAGSGTQNAALAFGGTTGTVSAITEKFNGNTWSATGSLSVARTLLAGSGTQNATLAFGGGLTSITERFYGQLQHGFQGIFKGSLNSLIINNSQNAITMNLGSESGILQLDVLFDINGGLSNQERIWITELEREDYQSGEWSANANMNYPSAFFAGAGTQNATLSFGGGTLTVEKFNGTAWSFVGAFPSSRFGHAGSGTQNAALAFGGFTTGPVASALTEKYDGNTWTSVTPNTMTARWYLSGAGTQNAALAYAGQTSSGVNSSITEKFNGSTWSVAGFGTTARANHGMSGTQNAALAFGGFSVGIASAAEKFNGSIWSATGSLGTARTYLSGSGTQNAALAFGGYPVSFVATGATEKFNGSIWSATGSLGTARLYLSGSGTQNAALAFGGSTTAGTSISVTEKFIYNLPFIPKTIGNGVWSSVVPTSITARMFLAGAGTQNAALAFGGSTGAVSAITEKFNGSIWSATGSLGTAKWYLAGSGTQNAALAFGGIIAAGTTSAITEKFNGSAWSATGSLGTARISLAGAGTQNAALAFGGSTGAVSAIAEKFDGSTWSATGSLGTARSALAGSGTQNAALAFGGEVGGSVASAITEKFNGSTWGATGGLGTARWYVAGSGVQNAALAFGGTNGAVALSAAEKFNGSAWSATGSLGTARSSLAGSGTQNAALAFGGYTTAVSDVTEKYNEISINGLQIN